MCGIAACIGEGAVKKVYGGLVSLEYRGYDSAGISVLEQGNICTVKHAGMVSVLEKELTSADGIAAIGHTRWATHGAPSDVNAHPHTAGKFSAVHNGIIENYAEIREELIREGRVFLSQTDSEVIAHLLDKYYSGNFFEAVERTVARLKGSFALCILCADCGCIAAVRMRSPLIVGKGKNCFFAASDLSALAGVATCAYALKDGQMAFLYEDGARFYDFSLNEFTPQYATINLTKQSVSLNGFPHFMLKEIFEVPAAVKDTLSAFDDMCKEAVIGLYCGVNDIILTGCGTAYHSALAASYIMEDLFGIPARAEVASELLSRRMVMGENTLFIAVSQSGETADTVEAARAARQRGAKILAVTNEKYCALNAVADAVVPVMAGKEVCVAATKSYCGQLAALYKITETLSGKKLCCLEYLYALCEHIVRCTDVQPLVKECLKSKTVYFIGRGADYPAALEGSLKLKEVSYIAGGAYPAGELKHGTLALIDKNALTIAVITDPRLAAKTFSSLEQISSRGGKIAVVAAKSCLSGQVKKPEICIELPECPCRISPILSAIPLQMAAYYAATALGNNPDKPRNLAKSVTVE